MNELKSKIECRMDQINVRRWASSLRQFHQPSIANDGCVGSTNSIRNASNNNEKTSLMSEKSQFDTLETLTKDCDHHELETASDAGTYIIDDEDDSEQNRTISSSSFKRYVNPAKARHGTFDIHGLISSTAHTIHRPIVDSNLQRKDISSSSSSTDSSLLSFNEDEENQSSIPQKLNPIKPAESFVISPVFATKSFPTTHIPRRIIEAPWKSKPIPSENPNPVEKSDQPPPPSFQRQTASAHAQYPRQRSSLPSKSFTSRKSTPMSTNNQTNRAVELRRARAQAKIEELTQRRKKQFSRPSHQPMDVMSSSWHSQTNKSNLRTTMKSKSTPQKEDFSVTRTILDNANHQNTEADRCDVLRDNGQRLAIKLIRLSSGILEKLKPNDIVSVDELEQLVSQLQTVNRTLTSIDAALTGSTPADHPFV